LVSIIIIKIPLERRKQMSGNKPCQHCSKRSANKRIHQHVDVKDLSSGNYGDSLASSDFKFEVCDVCARLLMDKTAIEMRNFALDLTKDGQHRSLLSAPGQNLSVFQTGEDTEYIDAEADDAEADVVA
jgi:hypothetical protein